MTCEPYSRWENPYDSRVSALLGQTEGTGHTLHNYVVLSCLVNFVDSAFEEYPCQNTWY